MAGESVERLLRLNQAMAMIHGLDGRLPLLLVGYEPATGEWRILCHPGLLQTLANDEQREVLKQNLSALLDQASHPENVQLVDARKPVPGPPPSPQDLEHLFPRDEGGEG